jgi:O-antigen ligase
MRSLVVDPRPGLTERALVLFVLFINLFGTPAEWFYPSSGPQAGRPGDPLLVWGTLAIAGALGLTLLGREEVLGRAVRLEPLLAGFIALILVSPLWSTMPERSITDVVNFVPITLVGYYLIIRYPIVELLRMAAAVCTAGILLTTFWAVALPQYGQFEGRWTGVFFHRNSLGNACAICIVIFLILSREWRSRRFLYYSMAALAGFNLAMSQSKTAIVATGITVVALVVYQAFRARRTLYGAVALTLAAGVTAAAAFATANIGMLAGWLGKDPTLTGRTQLWASLVPSIMERPWLGWGRGGFWHGWLSPAHDVWIANPWDPPHAHNSVLQIALEVGVVGAALFLAFMARGLVRGAVHIRSVPGAKGLFPLTYITFAVMISITEVGPTSQRFGFMLLVVALLQARHGIEQAARPRTPGPFPGVATPVPAARHRPAQPALLTAGPAPRPEPGPG